MTTKLETKDVIYFLSLEYKEFGYTDVLDKAIRRLTRELIQEKVINDREFMDLL